MADVSTNTISRLEAGEELKPRTIAAIRAALEQAGVIFVDENGDGPGVRLRKGALDAKAQPRHIAGASDKEKP